MISISFDSQIFEARLKRLADNIPFILPDLLKVVGEKMKQEAQAIAPVNTGKLRNNIRFLIDNSKSVYALTTSKKLGNSNIWYSNIREHGASINFTGKSKGFKNNQNRNGDYLMFKINGEWKKVKSVRTPAQPFMKPVFEEYFGSNASKGYTEIANALAEIMEKELG